MFGDVIQSIRINSASISTCFFGWSHECPDIPAGSAETVARGRRTFDVPRLRTTGGEIRHQGRCGGRRADKWDETLNLVQYAAWLSLKIKALNRLTAPTPMIAAEMLCMVDTGLPHD